MKDAGLVNTGGKQRTDSTHVVAAVRDLNRLELAGESVRAALEALAVTAPGWLAQVIDVTEWNTRSASSRNSIGSSRPRSGWSQRTNASTPSSSAPGRLTIGW